MFAVRGVNGLESVACGADWPGKEAVRMSPAVLSMWVALSVASERTLIDFPR